MINIQNHSHLLLSATTRSIKMNSSSNMTSNNSIEPKRLRALNADLQLALYTIIGFLALPGNLILVYLATFSKKLKMEGLVLLQNLAISDLFIIFVGVPITIANLATDEGLIKDGVMCQIQGCVILALFLNSNFNITYVALYRYLYIVKNDSNGFFTS